ncbi:MAG TPA: thioredoxin family protein [Bacteroidia bacterium]|nr:thioredoxin family protein [Bacteroidia bacterium]
MIFTINSSFTETELKLNWLTSFEQAKTLAEKQNKKILMSFSGSDWCANCMRLDKTLFQAEEFKMYAEKNLILLKVDFPSRKKNALSNEQQDHNDKLADKYNQKGMFPNVAIVDYKGGVLGNMKHPLNSASDYIENIKGILKK